MSSWITLKEIEWSEYLRFLQQRQQELFATTEEIDENPAIDIPEVKYEQKQELRRKNCEDGRTAASNSADHSAIECNQDEIPPEKMREVMSRGIHSKQEPAAPKRLGKISSSEEKLLKLQYSNQEQNRLQQQITSLETILTIERRRYAELAADRQALMRSYQQLHLKHQNEIIQEQTKTKWMKQTIERQQQQLEEREKVRQNQNQASIVLQSTFRSRLEQKRYQGLKLQRVNAAIAIQCMVRRVKAKKQLRELQELDRVAKQCIRAASQMQRFIRFQLYRKERALLVEARELSAMILQKNARRMIACAAWRGQKFAVLKLQCWVRQRLAMKNFKQIHGAVLVVKKAVLGWYPMWNCMERKTAARAQYSFAGRNPWLDDDSTVEALLYNLVAMVEADVVIPATSEHSFTATVTGDQNVSPLAESLEVEEPSCTEYPFASSKPDDVPVVGDGTVSETNVIVAVLNDLVNAVTRATDVGGDVGGESNGLHASNSDREDEIGNPSCPETEQNIIITESGGLEIDMVSGEDITDNSSNQAANGSDVQEGGLDAPDCSDFRIIHNLIENMKELVALSAVTEGATTHTQPESQVPDSTLDDIDEKAAEFDTTSLSIASEPTVSDQPLAEAFNTDAAVGDFAIPDDSDDESSIRHSSDGEDSGGSSVDSTDLMMEADAMTTIQDIPESAGSKSALLRITFLEVELELGSEETVTVHKATWADFNRYKAIPNVVDNVCGRYGSPRLRYDGSAGDSPPLQLADETTLVYVSGHTLHFTCTTRPCQHFLLRTQPRKLVAFDFNWKTCTFAIAAREPEATISLYSYPDKKLKDRLKSSDDHVFEYSSLKFSRCGRRLLSIRPAPPEGTEGRDPVLCVWDVETLAPVPGCEHSRISGPARFASFDPVNINQFIVGGDNGLQVWKIYAGKTAASSLLRPETVTLPAPLKDDGEQPTDVEWEEKRVQFSCHAWLPLPCASFPTGPACDSTVFTPFGGTFSADALIATGGMNGFLALWSLRDCRQAAEINIAALFSQDPATIGALTDTNSRPGTSTTDLSTEPTMIPPVVITALASRPGDPIVMIGDRQGRLRSLCTAKIIGGGGKIEVLPQHSVQLLPPDAPLDLLAMHPTHPVLLVSSTHSGQVFLLSLDHENRFPVQAFFTLQEPNERIVDIQWNSTGNSSSSSLTLMCFSSRGRFYSARYQAPPQEDISVGSAASGRRDVSPRGALQIVPKVIAFGEAVLPMCSRLRFLAGTSSSMMIATSPDRPELTLLKYRDVLRESTDEISILSKVLIKRAHARGISAIALFPRVLHGDVELLVTGGMDGTVTLWTLAAVTGRYQPKVSESESKESGSSSLKEESRRKVVAQQTPIGFYRCGRLCLPHGGANVSGTTWRSHGSEWHAELRSDYESALHERGSTAKYDDLFQPEREQERTSFLEARTRAETMAARDRFDRGKDATRIKLRELEGRLKGMLAENEQLPESEQLARDEFVLNVAWRDSLLTQHAARAQRAREGIARDLARMAIVRERMKREFWGVAEVPGVRLNALSPPTTTAGQQQPQQLAPFFVNNFQCDDRLHMNNKSPTRWLCFDSWSSPTINKKSVRSFSDVRTRFQETIPSDLQWVLNAGLCIQSSK
ncbi:WD40-repeat-containing domain [Phytophthora cactorum]|nr:WD40-repeat-containing domain [Phytophthora cactorum]